MAKKIFIYSLAVFLIALSALIIYKVFLSDVTPANLTSDEEVVDGENNSEAMLDLGSEKKAEHLTKVLDRNVKGATQNSLAAQVLFYENQKFLISNYEGQIKDSAGAYPFINVQDIKWHPSKEKALIRDNGTYFLYSLRDNSVVKFDGNADVVAWDAYGDRVIYKKYDSDSNIRRIEISKPDGKEPQTLVDNVTFKKVDLNVSPKGNMVCYFPTPDSNIEGGLSCLDTKAKQVKDIDKGRFGADYLWSPDGKMVLVSFALEKAGNRLTLGVFSAEGGEYKGLNFSSTVKKCTWSKDSKYVYCGAMNKIPDNAVMPNEWEANKVSSSDTFWKINMSNMKQTRLIDLEQTPGNLDGSNYFLDNDERNLFFTDRKTGNLFKINL